MDRRVEQQNKEAIKMTMLMQDRILKQQVKELHRLYNVQRKRMGQLKKETEQLPHSLNLADSQSATDQVQPLDHDTVSKEIVGDLTGVPFTLVDYFDLKRQSPKDNKGLGLDTTDRPSTSSSVGTGNLRINDGDDGGVMVDLALSIGLGGGSSKKST